MLGLNIRSFIFCKSVFNNGARLSFSGKFSHKHGYVTTLRSMHYKQAIRPAILPDGLPAETLSWKMIRRDVRLSFLTGNNVTLDPAEMIKADELVPLKASVDEVDYKVVRRRVTLLYHHRVYLLLQRVRYLSTINITKREKYKSIKADPPALIIWWGGKKQTGYLRGIVTDDTKKLLVLYPMFYHLNHSKSDQEEKCKFIGEELGVELEKVLKLAYSIPCFMLNRGFAEASGHEFLYVHKFLTPKTYNFDEFTAKMHPPIFNSKEVGKTYRDTVGGTIPSNSFQFKLNNVLDMTYPSFHGKVNMEDLTSFLKEARAEEIYQLRAKGFNKKIEHYR